MQEKFGRKMPIYPLDCLVNSTLPPQPPLYSMYTAGIYTERSVYLFLDWGSLLSAIGRNSALDMRVCGVESKLRK